MITYASVAERLELYRSEDHAGAASFKFLGAIDIHTGKEYKPFLASLSAAEKTEVEKCRIRALAQYREANALDLSKLSSDLLTVASAIQDGMVKPSSEEAARLMLAWQKLRTSMKGTSTDKKVR